MSYSVTCVGSPEAVKRRLRQTSETLTDQSKREFDDVLPSLEAIVDQNSNNETKVCLRLEAHGHAYFNGGVKQYGNCTVKIEPIGVLAE